MNATIDRPASIFTGTCDFCSDWDEAITEDVVAEAEQILEDDLRSSDFYGRRFIVQRMHEEGHDLAWTAGRLADLIDEEERQASLGRAS